MADKVTKYRVTIPGVHRDIKVFYGIQFVGGVAENVTDNYALSNFRQWGYFIEEMGPRVADPVVADEKVVAEALKAVAEAPKGAKKAKGAKKSKDKPPAE